MLGQLLDAGNTTTLSHYLTLLSDSGLLGGIEKYSGSMVQVRAYSPKLQVFNNALLTSLSDTTFENVLINPAQWGRLIESAVGAHLINYRMKGNYELYYWREGILEVDFVLRKGTKIIGIEVKSSAKTENKGMSVFAKKYNQAKVMVVGTNGFPFEEFLGIDPAELF